MSHILVAEDNAGIASFVEKGLRAAGYLTTATDNGESALLLARSGAFDLMVLDVGLPRLDGFRVLQQLRREGAALPVVMLTARDSVDDTVMGLDGGANDYMTKPFQFAELLARVRLRLRDHVEPGAPALLEAAGLTLDARTRRVSGPGLDADLTAREYALLETLMRHPDHVLSREQLLGQVWGVDVDPSSNVVDVFIRGLRRKIGAERIETVRGMGYRLRVRR